MMNNFKTSTKKDLETFILDNSFKKIFILAGNQSFQSSGLKEFFSRGFNNKELKLTINSLEQQEISKNCEILIINGGGKIPFKTLSILKKKYKLKIIKG